MSKKIIVMLLVIALASLGLFTGCAARKPGNPVPEPNKFNDTGTPANPGTNFQGPTGTQNDLYYKGPAGTNAVLPDNTTLPNNNNLGTATTQADGISRAVQDINGVKASTVVISGRTAYVGVNLDINNASDSDARVQAIKKQVADRVRAVDNGIDTVYVSADPDFLQRIGQIANGIRNGSPIDSFRNELSELVKRLTPERQ